MNRHHINQMADFQPKPKKPKSRWWHWAIILAGAALMAWLLISAGQNQQNPGPPAKKMMRVA